MHIDDFGLLDKLPKVLPIVAITHPNVFYPYAVAWYRSSPDEKDITPLVIEDMRQCGDLAVLVPTKPDTKTPYKGEDIYRTGVLAQVAEIQKTSEGTYRKLYRGIERVSIIEITQEKPYIKAKVEFSMPAQNFDTDLQVKTLHEEVIDRA
jgi:ATP-dependent Lon protease